MTTDDIIADLTGDNEKVIHIDFPDIGAFHQPRPIRWHDFFWSFIWAIPVAALIYFLFSEDLNFILTVSVLLMFNTIVFSWLENRALSRAENFRNLIMTDQRILLINRALNYDGSLRVRYLDPSNFTDVTDHFEAGHWWAAATTRDDGQAVPIAMEKTEQVKSLIREYFLTSPNPAQES